MNIEENSEKQILMAFFDILGTSQLLNTGEFYKVYEYYSDMIQLCNDSHTPIYKMTLNLLEKYDEGNHLSTI